MPIRRTKLHAPCIKCEKPFLRKTRSTKLCDKCFYKAREEARARMAKTWGFKKNARIIGGARRIGVGEKKRANANSLLTSWKKR